MWSSVGWLPLSSQLQENILQDHQGGRFRRSSRCSWSVPGRGRQEDVWWECWLLPGHKCPQNPERSYVAPLLGSIQDMVSRKRNRSLAASGGICHENALWKETTATENASEFPWTVISPAGTDSAFPRINGWATKSNLLIHIPGYVKSSPKIYLLPAKSWLGRTLLWIISNATLPHSNRALPWVHYRFYRYVPSISSL